MNVGTLRKLLSVFLATLVWAGPLRIEFAFAEGVWPGSLELVIEISAAIVVLLLWLGAARWTLKALGILWSFRSVVAIALASGVVLSLVVFLVCWWDYHVIAPAHEGGLAPLS
jgi:hypothetical protein